MFCAHCGGEIERVSKFCKHCGISVASPPTVTISKSTLSKILAAIGAAIVVGLIAYIAFHLMYDSSTYDKKLSVEAGPSTQSTTSSNPPATDQEPRSRVEEYDEYLKAVNPSVERIKAINDSVNSVMAAYANSSMTAETAALKLKTYFDESYKLDKHLQNVTVPNWLATTHAHLTSATSSYTMAISTLQFAIESQNLKTLNNYQESMKYATGEMKKYGNDLKGYNATLKTEKTK